MHYFIAALETKESWDSETESLGILNLMESHLGHKESSSEPLRASGKYVLLHTAEWMYLT